MKNKALERIQLQTTKEMDMEINSPSGLTKLAVACFTGRNLSLFG